MTRNFTERLAKIEATTTRAPTHEEALEALMRYENPHPGYTAEQRAADIDTLRRDAAALAAAGLA